MLVDGSSLWRQRLQHIDITRLSYNVVQHHGTRLLHHGTRLPHHGTRLLHHGTRLPHHGTRLPHHGTRLPHHGTRLLHHGTRLLHHGTRLLHHGTRLLHHGTRLPHHGTRLPHHGTRLPRYKEGRLYHGSRMLVIRICFIHVMYVIDPCFIVITTSSSHLFYLKNVAYHYTLFSDWIWSPKHYCLRNDLTADRYLYTSILPWVHCYCQLHMYTLITYTTYI